MDKSFQDLERLFEIEALLSDLENACKESEEAVAFETDQLRYVKVQLLSLESPDFFLRLMPARLEKKKENAQAEVRAHTAALEEARRGETTRGSQLLGNRKPEFLSKASEDARKLQELLDHLPSSLQLKGSYLSWPDHYVTEPTTPYAQMDRLNMAVDTVRDVRNQLRELL